MPLIKLDNSILIYQTDFRDYGKDTSWVLDTKTIIVIGIINKMVGDDDSDFIVFINKTLNKYFLNLTYEIKGWDQVVLHLKNIFNISFENTIVDAAITIYPLSLKKIHFTKQQLNKQ
jgi:hypothetical protein